MIKGLKGRSEAFFSPRALTPALPSPGCSCDPRGTLGGVTECRSVSRCQGIRVCGSSPSGPCPAKSHCLFLPRATGSVSVRLMCVARPVQPARMASSAWIVLTISAAVVSAHMCPPPTYCVCCTMHSGRRKSREVQVGQAGRGLTLATADVQLASWPQLCPDAWPFAPCCARSRHH